MILVQRGVHYLGMNIMMPKIPVLPEYENRINQFVRTQLSPSSMDDSVWYSTSTGRYRFNPVHGSVHVSAFGHDMMYSREYVHNVDSKVNTYLTQKIHPVLGVPVHKLNDPMMNGMLSYTTLPLPDKSWYDGKLRDRYV